MLQSILLVSLLAGVQPQGAMPPIGIIDVYGATHVTEQDILQALQLKVGDPFPTARAGREAKLRVNKIPGVAQVRLSGMCCDEGKTVMWIGIQEVGEPVLQFRGEPRGSILPDDVITAGAAFDDALERRHSAGTPRMTGAWGTPARTPPSVPSRNDSSCLPPATFRACARFFSTQRRVAARAGCAVIAALTDNAP